MQVTEPALTASGIAVRYGRRAVLDGAGLDLHRGEVVAVVGENGSGKTTLLRVCAGLLAPDAGRVERAGRVGYCPQDPALVDLLTPDEHLVLFGRAVGLDRDRAVRDGRRLFDDLGLRAPRGATVKELSGGRDRRSTSRSRSWATPTSCCSTSPPRASTRGRTSTSGSAWGTGGPRDAPWPW